MFDDPLRQVVEDDADYGEERFIATGRVGNVILVVVYTERNRRERIISARKASLLCPDRVYIATNFGKGERTGRASKP